MMASFFSDNLGGEIPKQITFQTNLSLAGFIHRLLSALRISDFELAFRWGAVFLILCWLSLLSLKQYPHEKMAFTFLLTVWIMTILLVSPTTWENNLVWMLPAFGSAATVLTDDRSRFPVSYFFYFALCYSVVAFENLPINRFGQWQFQSGWWIFGGDYLRTSFVVDVKLFAVVGLFLFCGLLFYHIQPEITNVVANVKTWFGMKAGPHVRRDS
jgi:hypothetical protein